MDRFNEYWEQLSNKSDPIGKELISYYKTLHETEDGSHLSQPCCNFLLQNLLRNPYPTCQLLRLLATSRIPTKNSAIREICDAGMSDFLETFSAEKLDKFYNLVANNLLSSAAIEDVVPVILGMLAEDGRVDRERLLLALVARRSQKLLKRFLKEMEVPLEVGFLMEVIEGRRHFVERMLMDGGGIPFEDQFIRDYIRFFQVIAGLNGGKAVEDVPKDLDLPGGSALKMYYLELKRTRLLQGLFGDDLQMVDYAKESSVLALYLKQEKMIEPGSYEQLLGVIAENDRLNGEILSGVECDQPEDYKLLQMLILWKHAMEMIQLPSQLHTFEAVLEIKVNAIRNTLKSVDDIQIFVELLESLLTLLFVRYEHLPQKPIVSGGFMCSPAVLEAILSSLQVVVTQRNHAANYVESSDHLKERLSTCLTTINDALWRLSLVKEMSSTRDSQLQLTDADSSNIILKLPDLVQDDDDRVFASVDLDAPKRRLSKRHQRYSQPSSSGSTSHKQLTTQHSLPLPNQLPAGSSISSLTATRPKTLFSKILGTPEKLATLCLVNKNLEAARKIVQTRNLSNTPIGQDLTFLDNFAQVQQKLTSLIANYDNLREAQRNDAGDPLKEIRSRTAIGFEATKIVSIVENFALGQRVNQTEDDRQLLEKHSGQYPFLRLFLGDPLKNIHAVDLLLGLPMSYDLNLSLYNLVEKSVGPNSEGYAGFLKRLIDDLQQYKQNNCGEATLHQLLTQEVCPLDPTKLSLVLESRSQIATLRSLEDVPPGGRWVQFRRIARFVEQVEKLCRLHGEWNESFKAEEAMRLDLQEIVSRLVFEKGVALDHLEPMVSGTNSNLAHIIARNYVYEVGKPPKFDLSNHPEVLEFVTSKNDLLGSLIKQIVSGSGDHALLNNLNDLPAVIACKDLYGNRTAAALDYDRFGLELLEAIADDFDKLNYLELIAERDRDSDRIMELRHEIVTRLIEANREDVQLEEIIMRTKDVQRQAEYLLQVVDRFSNANTIIKLIETVQLSKKVSELPQQVQESLSDLHSKLQVYVEVGRILEHDDWRLVQSLSENNKELVLYQLVQQNLYDLCSRWIRLHPLEFNEEDSRMLDVFTLALTKASREGKDCSALLVIIEGLPVKRVVRFYETILLGVKSEAIIRHAIEYLEKHGDNLKIYQKYRISLEIFAHLPVGSSERLWHLISRPLLIVEQFLMNSKLELLAAVMGSVRPLLVGTVCQICFEQREYIRDLRRRISGSINLDSSHDDQFITNECVDSLLRIYAGKALDYRVSNDSATSGESMHEQSTELSSLDSLCGAFVMPKEAPTKDGWVRDEDASHCMCCRRSVFSMLNRRHHCRRCGRVVCHGCSKKKLVIPELYEEVAVRACDDCVKQSQQAKLTVPAQSAGKAAAGGLNESQDEWQLTGNVRNDNILREEYSYEYAPSTSQCLAICNLHSQNEEISSFLLYHCVNLETLLRPIHPGYPNPEVDYALVARMLLNLTLAAKVRGLDFAEADKIKEHAEIILSMVKNDCETLLLQESMSSANLRKLRDALVLSEKWSLALELSLKCGFATSGVMAAWGNACLRAGCYETAREKFSHCLQRVATDADTATILNCIESPETKLANYRTAKRIKRPLRSPPLLLEIISILESTAQAQPPEVLARASKIKSSNTSLASSTTRIKNNAPLHEPALNILNTLANLKNITKGNFTDFLPERRALRNRDLKQPLPGNSSDYLQGLDCIMSTWFFEESMFYLLTYGAHHDVVAFLIKNRQILPVLKYVLMQHVDPEVFLQTVLLPYVRRGKLETIIQVMSSMDPSLLIWKNYIIHACRHLEQNRMLNCLYNLQLLLGDPVRASMTCVRFYSMDAKSFTDLDTNAFHLKNSVRHLEAELELSNWEDISSDHSRPATHPSLLMKMEPKQLNANINTILRQIEVAKFLAQCEAKGARDVIGLLPKVDDLISTTTTTTTTVTNSNLGGGEGTGQPGGSSSVGGGGGSKVSSVYSLLQLFIETARIPTVFGHQHERLQLAVLVLICGKNVDEGFGLSYRISHDFNLNLMRVYNLVAKYFINESRIDEVEKLIQAIASNGGPTADADTTAFCDELIQSCVSMAIGVHGSSSHIKTALEALIKRVSDVGAKISCYCSTGQLKSAYLLANRTGRLSDIRKILRQAEVLNQGHVKRLCQAKLAGEGNSGGGAVARKSTG